MGVYNIVNYEMECPVCKAHIMQFQTKEGAGMFDVVPYNQVSNFHAICSHCQAFIEFYYSPESRERNIEDYKVRIVKLGKNGS